MKIFGIEHIIYLVVSIALTVGGLVVSKLFCKSEKSKQINVRVTAGAYLILLILNRIFCVTDLNDSSFFPYSACAVIGFALCLCVTFSKKNSKPLLGLSLMAILSGLISTVYPTYLPTNSFNGVYAYSCTITSLLHHSLAIYMPILMLLLGYVKIDIKNWTSAPLSYCVLIVYGLFVIKIVGKGDAMLINNPILRGTIFNWFYLGLMFMGIYTVLLFVYDSIANKSNCFVCKCWKQVCNFWNKLFGKKKNCIKADSTPPQETNLDADQNNQN